MGFTKSQTCEYRIPLNNIVLSRVFRCPKYWAYISDVQVVTVVYLDHPGVHLHGGWNFLVILDLFVLINELKNPKWAPPEGVHQFLSVYQLLGADVKMRKTRLMHNVYLISTEKVLQRTIMKREKIQPPFFREPKHPEAGPNTYLNTGWIYYPLGHDLNTRHICRLFKPSELNTSEKDKSAWPEYCRPDPYFWNGSHAMTLEGFNETLSKVHSNGYLYTFLPYLI